MISSTNALTVYDEAFAGSQNRYAERVEVNPRGARIGPVGIMDFACLFSGPPGGGKSRLQEEVARMLSKEPITVEAREGSSANAEKVTVKRNYGIYGMCTPFYFPDIDLSKIKVEHEYTRKFLHQKPDGILFKIV
ncbi:MAG: hypothetical protein PHH54_01980 [Candidatus Nanoarchaeia archaeon]|nr:hypothetical protein [Candidatus Nanoarchaeia archaeon]MDD5740731.1 hypothetical protein [Candidatus Nanoarchaeia archaeon]